MEARDDFESVVEPHGARRLVVRDPAVLAGLASPSLETLGSAISYHYGVGLKNLSQSTPVAAMVRDLTRDWIYRA